MRWLNDKAEILHGQNVLSDVLEYWPGPHTQIGQAMFEFIKNRMPELFSRVRMFVACLCQESDLANQWFMYADRGRGFELGFDLGPKRRLLVRDAGVLQTPAALEPVTYDHDIQRAQLVEALSDSLNALNKVRASNLAKDPGNLAARAGSMANGELAQRIAVMKHRSFRNELEWRFTYVQGIGHPENQLIKFRGPNHDIPYVPLELRGEPAKYGEDRLPLCQVLIGPHAPHENAGQPITKQLSGLGYGEPLVSARDSECPLQVP